MAASRAPCQGHALLLAARKLVGIASAKLFQLDQRQHLLDPLLNVGLGHVRYGEAKANIVGYVHVGKQSIRLKHHADIALVWANAGDVLAVHHDAAGGGNLKTGHHAQRRRLAAAAGPQKGNKLAAIHGQVEVFDGCRLRIRKHFAYVAEL